MIHIFDRLKDPTAFAMTMAGHITFFSWEQGFDGFFEGKPREDFVQHKHSRQGWEAGLKISMLKEKLEHEPKELRQPFVLFTDEKEDPENT